MGSTKEKLKEKLRENKIFFIAIISFLCILLIILTFNREEQDPITNMVTRALSPALSFVNSLPVWFSNMFSGNELAYEVEYLRLELANLNAQLSRLELLEEANREMAELLQMYERYPEFEMIGANVIARTSSNWNTEFMINQGYSNGVLANMAVFKNGLVGRIIAVNYDTSVVLPIIDDTSSVSATVRRSGENGFANGDVLLSPSGVLRFEAPLGTDIIIGDEIITSNLGVIFPPALIIGVVSEISETGSSLSAIIEPETNFRNLSSILVITN